MISNGALDEYTILGYSRLLTMRKLIMGMNKKPIFIKDGTLNKIVTLHKNLY